MVFENKVSEMDWKISSNQLSTDHFVYSYEDYQTEKAFVVKNIRKLSIDNTNHLNMWADCLSNVRKLSIAYPLDGNYSVYLEIFNLKLAIHAEIVWLENYKGEYKGILPELTQLSLKRCSLKNIDWNEKLEAIRIESAIDGIDDLKNLLKVKPVASQAWIDRPNDLIEADELGRYAELFDDTDGRSVYVNVDPRRICGSDWLSIQILLESHLEYKLFIDHLFIDARRFEESERSDVLPSISGIPMRSLKLFTTNERFYKAAIEKFANKEQNDLPQQITEIACYDGRGVNVEKQFYYNMDAQYAETTDCEMIDTCGSVKYLTYILPNNASLNEKQIEVFVEKCAELSFLKMTALDARLNTAIQKLPLPDGFHIANEYIDIFSKKNERTEVIFKMNDAHDTFGSIGSLQSIPLTDTSYCFEFGKYFLFDFCDFPNKFMGLISKLSNAESIEFRGFITRFRIHIQANTESVGEAFKPLVNLRRIQIKGIGPVLPHEFGILLLKCPFVQYFIVTFPPTSKILNSLIETIPIHFKSTYRVDWYLLEAFTNRIRNTFVFSNNSSIDPTEEKELKAILERPSLETEFIAVIEEKRPIFKEKL